MFQVFTESFKEAPTELILDFDATDNELHGNQIAKHFHGYYGHYCFLPLHVYCGKHLLVSYLRTSAGDGAKHSWTILSLLVKNIRKKLPNVRIIFRDDNGFCRQHMFNWSEKHQVKYIVGLSSKQVLNRLSFRTYKKSAKKYVTTKKKQKYFSIFRYKTKSWKKRKESLSNPNI